MKTRHLLTVIATLSFSLNLPAGDEHGHSHEKREAGPNGGRLLTSVDPHAEFFVTPERKIQITFVDHDGKVVAATDQSVSVTAGERSAPTKFTFEKSGEVLLSGEALPNDETVPAVVQIKMTPDAKTVVEKFNLNLATCPGCSFGEYACACDHAH